MVVCTTAIFLVYCSVEKLMHQRPNPIHFFFQREMARVEKMELCTGNISFKEFSSLHRYPQAWESDCGTYEKTTESRARAKRSEHLGDRLRDRRCPAPPRLSCDRKRSV